MNAAAGRMRRSRARNLRWIAVFTLASVVASSAATEAAAIRKYHEADSAEDGLSQSWTHFLLGGPSFWAAHPHPLYDFQVRETIWNIIKTDPGGENPMIAFLLWKQSLDPTRFDHFHPNIGPAIDKLVAPKLSETSTPTSTSTSPSTSTTTTSPPSEGQQLSPPTATPEPSTWVMTIGMAGWAFWRCRRKR
jgi:PEP-CTERM motif